MMILFSSLYEQNDSHNFKKQQKWNKPKIQFL